MRDNPGIYVKSHPKGEENQPHIELHFSLTANNKNEAEEKLRKAVPQLSGLVMENKGKIFPKDFIKSN
jgi:hypothetical protein